MSNNVAKLILRELEYDDDLCVVYFYDKLVFRGTYDEFKEYEFEELGDYIYGYDIMREWLEWDETNKRYSGNGFEMYILDLEK